MSYTDQEKTDLQAVFGLWLDGRFDQIEQHDGNYHWRPFDGVLTTTPASHWRYRPKPAPTVRPWREAADVPLNCWMRKKSHDGFGVLVIGIHPRGIEGVVTTAVVSLLCWGEMKDWEHSTDRIHWSACAVTEPATNGGK